VTRVVILGCGYVGLAAAVELKARGCEVVGVRRGEEGRAEVESAGIRFAAADVADPAALASLPGPFDWIVNTVSSSRGGLNAYRCAFESGSRAILAWAATMAVKKLVFTSSTSVYGQTDGSIVDESSPAAPDSEGGRVLRSAEEMLLASARAGCVPAIVLRLAGIYGPGRGHLFQQFLAGTARIEGDGRRWINMIHRDDAAGAIIAALLRGAPGEIYNVTDNEPAPQGEFLRDIARRTGRAAPPVGPPPDAASRKRPPTHKRVSNAKLRMLGWEPLYPSWREGYAAEVLQVRSNEELNNPPARPVSPAT
jgi:nucleoside-diphosphate-sugar epimerase